MNEPTRVSATDFSKEVGRYQDLALTKAVVVTRNGRDRTVMISADEYRRLTRLSAGEGAGEATSPAPAVYSALDPKTKRAVEAFLKRVRQHQPALMAMLYGSRARGTHTAASDADIAVILEGQPQNRFAALGPLADAAFDVLMETGIHIQPLALWESELQRPELFSNPGLIAAIKRDGVQL
jgi:predicted nucleotidyltransferase